METPTIELDADKVRLLPETEIWPQSKMEKAMIAVESRCKENCRRCSVLEMKQKSKDRIIVSGPFAGDGNCLITSWKAD